MDDEILIAQGIQLIILRMKTAFEEVDVAFSGQEALEKLENTQYDLMITDINMPDMSGLELIRQVKERKLCDNFCVLSGYSEFEYAQSAVRLGVSEYLLKPVDKEKLRATLENCFQQLQQNRKQTREAIDNQLRKLMFGSDSGMDLPWGEQEILLCVAWGWPEGSWQDLESLCGQGVAKYALTMYHAPAAVLVGDPEKQKILIKRLKEMHTNVYLGFQTGRTSQSAGFRQLFQEAAQAALYGRWILDCDVVDAAIILSLPRSQDANFAQEVQRRFGVIVSADRLVLYQINLQNLIQDIPDTGRDEMNPYVRKMQELSQKRYREDLGLKEIAGEVNLSPEYAGRLFRNETGIRFQEYVNQLRISQILQAMMQNPELSFEQLAPTMGFTDMTSFFRVFKRIMKMTPGEYRKKMRQYGTTNSHHGQDLPLPPTGQRASHETQHVHVKVQRHHPKA